MLFYKLAQTKPSLFSRQMQIRNANQALNLEDEPATKEVIAPPTTENKEVVKEKEKVPTTEKKEVVQTQEKNPVTDKEVVVEKKEVAPITFASESQVAANNLWNNRKPLEGTSGLQSIYSQQDQNRNYNLEGKLTTAWNKGKIDSENIDDAYKQYEQQYHYIGGDNDQELLDQLNRSFITSGKTTNDKWSRAKRLAKLDANFDPTNIENYAKGVIQSSTGLIPSMADSGKEQLLQRWNSAKRLMKNSGY